MAQTPSPEPGRPQQRCSGSFKVRIQAPQTMGSPEGGPAQARRPMEKQFDGGLEGQSQGEMLAAGSPQQGEMLAAGSPQQGEAAYVALESFQGRLEGRAGGFALAHLGLMHAGQQDLRIVIVPGSGTGGLQGISGELSLRIEGGVHHYELVYTLPPAPGDAPRQERALPESRG